jgi:hypothetical protein
VSLDILIVIPWTLHYYESIATIFPEVVTLYLLQKSQIEAKLQGTFKINRKPYFKINKKHKILDGQ